MKPLLKPFALAALVLALFVALPSVWAQVSVGPLGVPPITFDTLPPANPDPQARLVVGRVNGQLALVWGEPGFILELAGQLNGPWQPIATHSPAILAPTNGTSFFRLRR